MSTSDWTDDRRSIGFTRSHINRANNLVVDAGVPTDDFDCQVVADGASLGSFGLVPQKEHWPGPATGHCRQIAITWTVDSGGRKWRNPPVAAVRA